MVNPMIIHGVKKTTKIMKVLGEDAIGWEYVVCDLSEVIFIMIFLYPTNIRGVQELRRLRRLII